jgi:hypothetical protein
MTRAVSIVLFLCGEALAHPGHGAPDSHFHEIPIVVLAVLVAACVVFRTVKYLSERTTARSAGANNAVTSASQ